MTIRRTRDEFSRGVTSVLAYRAGFRCSKPSCRALTVGPSDEAPDARSNVGVASHITAAAPGGPRFDPVLSPDERASVGNGIWLCQTHGKEVDDDVIRFSADLLRAWKQDVEEETRTLLGRPISAQAIDVALTISMHRAESDALAVAGTTNLPDGTKLWVTLSNCGAPEPLQTVKCTTGDGLFCAQGFLGSTGPFAHGWYEVEVLSYFNGPWKQPSAVLGIVGEQGKHLAGRYADPLHAELDESEKRLRAAFHSIAPLLWKTSPRASSDLDRALQIVKEAVLTVDGRASADPIGEVVDHFMKSPGLRKRDGWTARALPNGAILATYSFWNGPLPAESTWLVILDSREVRYRDVHGKYMSWLPPD